MSSLHANNIDKPVETIHPDNTPDATPDVVVSALNTAVDQSAEHGEVDKGIHAPMHKLPGIPLLHNLVPGLEKLATEYHVGNFVVVRGTGEKFFESMPLYPRYDLARNCFFERYG
jgi:phosphatidylserine decarboxylase